MRNIGGRKAKKRGELALPAPSPRRPVAEDSGRLENWVPDVDIIDGEREVTVRAEIPGIDPKDLEVTVSGDVLTISGQKSEEKEERGKAFFRSERRYGAFRRSLMLPPRVDPLKVSAEVDKGVLTVRIPKTPP